MAEWEAETLLTLCSTKPHMLSAPRALAQTKAAVLEHSDTLFSPGFFEQLVGQHADKRRSDEAREGMASFQEKRKPDWVR